MVTSIIVSLPRETWVVLLPVAWPFPILLWLAGRSGPVFAAAGAFLVSSIIVWTTTFGIGHFGDASFPLADRVLEAQTAILFLAVSAYLLAALFAEQRNSEGRLARSNMTLERERENKLLSLEAVAASINHELRQPLTAISASCDAALLWIARDPPELPRLRVSLERIAADSCRASEIMGGVQSLFQKSDQANRSVDINETIVSLLKHITRRTQELWDFSLYQSRMWNAFRQRKRLPVTTSHVQSNPQCN